MAMLEMRLEGVVYDILKRPIVILRYDSRILPILVGTTEAYAIIHGMEKVEMSRPLTHDLITFILKGFKTTLQSVQVYKLEESTFYAYLTLHQEDDGSSEINIIKIDCRPSDAIAIAVRLGSPIYVEEEVLRIAGQDANVIPEENLDKEEEDFGEGEEEDYLE